MLGFLPNKTFNDDISILLLTQFYRYNTSLNCWKILTSIQITQ